MCYNKTRIHRTKQKYPFFFPLTIHKGLMNILITGAAGFLGTHCFQSLRQDNHTLTLVDIASPENERQTPACRFENVDIRREHALTPLIREADIVIHAAAALPLWKRGDIFSTNVDGTRNILTAALEHGIQRVVYLIHRCLRDSEKASDPGGGSARGCGPLR